MKKQMFNVGILTVMLGALSLAAGCSQQKPGNKDGNAFGAPVNDGKAGPKVEPPGQVLETVDLTPGKAISPEDRAKVSSIGLKILAHVSKAQQDIQAKNVDAAKKELTQATTLLTILKKVLPTINVIDHIWVTKTKSGLCQHHGSPAGSGRHRYVPSINFTTVLPAGKAKEHAKRAKDVLTKEKQKGASKAKEELEAVEEALDFSEVDLSVSYTGRLVKIAQGDLEKGKTKEAGAALQAVADGLVFFDTTLINPADLAVRSIWMARQDYRGQGLQDRQDQIANGKNGSARNCQERQQDATRTAPRS